MSLSWDHPDADPAADVRAFVKKVEDSRNDPKVFLCPAKLDKAWREAYERPMTDADVRAYGFDKVAFA